MVDHICFFSLTKCCKNCQSGAQNETKVTKKGGSCLKIAFRCALWDILLRFVFVLQFLNVMFALLGPRFFYCLAHFPCKIP